MFFSSIQIIPLIEDACQTEMHFSNNLKWLIACHLQYLPVCLGCQMKFVICFLQVTQSDGCQDAGKGCLGCLAERDRFCEGLSGSSTLTLEHVCNPQGPMGIRTSRDVFRIQILESAARLSDHRF